MAERSVSVAQAKAHLSELLASGERITVTKRGVAIATIVPHDKPKKKIDLQWLREMTKDMPMQPEDAGTVLRRIRADYRY